MTARRDPVECPHCGEPTQPNELADGSTVCSCAAEREIGGAARLPPRPGRAATAPGGG
ncbi:hypothetical protein [Neoroseomonas alkaliterrae]|uniref:hypothetical protein n=1 Tax=Neoroseomonas alkaliterrae TaxID=1452450 RepID=UPI001609B5B9|nr:hypothetical protein [Neoroseomonas alkaliterrae]